MICPTLAAAAVSSPGSPASGPLWAVIVACVSLFLVVELLVIFAALRWRPEPAGGSAPRRNRPLEVVWLATPALVLIGLVAWTHQVLGSDVRNVPEKPDLRVFVSGRMFVWEIRHEIPGVAGESEAVAIETLNQLHLPVGEPVEIVLESQDVAHSFWIPQFRVKADAVPGATTSVWIRPMETGEFNIVCAELCGNSHFAMKGFVHVHTREAFDEWVRTGQARDASSGPPLETASPAIREQPERG